MPGLVPGIHGLRWLPKDVDSRDKPGHDGETLWKTNDRAFLLSRYFPDALERDVNETVRTFGVTPTEQILTYDGLGFLQAIVDGTLPAPPIAESRHDSTNNCRTSWPRVAPIERRSAISAALAPGETTFPEDEVYPLADGWQSRVPLHQLHLLLVHTAAFGASYQSAVRTAAEAALRGL